MNSKVRRQGQKVKSLLLPAVIGILLLLVYPSVYSQEKGQYIPDHGFWELVNEKDQKNSTIVRFYTDDRQLIYEEKVRGVRFNMNRVRTFRWLKEGLDKAMVTWSQQQKALFDKAWMAQIVRR